ncbi:hypothetical protein QTI33_26055 [Variovorax sp. J22P271]|uniref:hypothetical protein n=1 Tax=Variovorax davisae TaxID=3053515 RepID=UPI0025763F1B|nr:hypothetical protein [Variovorax sp. J22P271]MDM0035624.1 hypothetical protein [Variovorax sp. J22P271]
MDFLGIHLTLLIGPSVPLPAPVNLMEALEEVEVHTGDDRSGFQIRFQVGRSGPADLLDYALLASPLLQTWNRVIVIVTFNATPRVLMDGFVTQREFSASHEPGRSFVTLTGDDVSVKLDLEEKSAEHVGLDDGLVALKLIGSYAEYGLIPKLIPPPVIDPPLPIDRVPVQLRTDLEHLRFLALRHGYVFYIVPGPVPMTNTAYWGPPVRAGLPQSAITVNMGPNSNVSDFSVHSNGLGPTQVSGKVQDRLTNQALPVRLFASLRPPLAALPAWLVDQPNVRTTRFRESGVDAMQAYGRAQALIEDSMDLVVAHGELDALRYGDILQPRGVVGVRGAGYLHDGLWYVKNVRHRIRKENYSQSFTLAREGWGSTVPVVRP